MKIQSLILLTATAVSAQAATLGVWTASGGANPGTDGWALTTSTGNSSQAGSFQGNSGGNGDGAGAGAGNPAWGFYANSGQSSSGVWSLAGGSLTVGQEVAIDFDNGFINTGSQVGVEFRSGTTVGLSIFLTGGASFYQVFRNGGVVNSTVGFTDNGFNIEVGSTGTSTYALSFGSFSQTGTFGNGVTAIDNIRVFNTNAGGGGQFNLFANNITVVPEPASALLGSLGLLALLRRRK
jgi:hypothetical protein